MYHISGQNIKFVPNVFAANISFQSCFNISRVKKVVVGELWEGGCGGGGGVYVGWLYPMA